MGTWKPTYVQRNRFGLIPRHYPHATSWVPLAFMLAAIAAESTRIAGTSTTEHLLLACTHRLHVATRSSEIITTNWELRKVGHFSGYGFLGLLTARCWARRIPTRRTPTRRTSTRPHCTSLLVGLQAAAVGTLCAAIVASLDEWHQSFLPGRCASIHDVMLDTLGAVTCILLYLAYTLRPPRAS